MLSDLAAAEPGISWDRVLFCAKETVYKAWYPLARRWLGFEDAEFVISASDGSFAARILVPVPEAAEALALESLPGRWLVSDGLVVTAMALPGSRPELPARRASPGMDYVAARGVLRGYRARRDQQGR
jgi:4'-phosphopantetheinyl transferase EntD